MRVTDQYGRLLAMSCGCGPNGLLVPQPLVYNPDTGGVQSVVTQQIDGNTVASPSPPSPKIQDDDDRLWRHVYYQIIDDEPVFYLSEEADAIPGYPLISFNISNGRLDRAYSRKENGNPVMYWLPLS